MGKMRAGGFIPPEMNIESTNNFTTTIQRHNEQRTIAIPVTVHGQKWRNYKKMPLITSHSLFFVIFMSYKVQTPHYFFDFWRFLARERLPIPILLSVTQRNVLLRPSGCLITPYSLRRGRRAGDIVGRAVNGYVAEIPVRRQDMLRGDVFRITFLPAVPGPANRANRYSAPSPPTRSRPGGFAGFPGWRPEVPGNSHRMKKTIHTIHTYMCINSVA